MSQASASNKRRLILFVAAFVLVSAALAGVLFFAMRGARKHGRQPAPPNISYLDKSLGLEPIDGIDEDGFYKTEISKTWKGESYRWTNGAAKLVVPLGDRRPAALYVRLGLTVPRTLHLQINANGQSLVDEQVEMKGDWIRTFDLTMMNLGKDLTLDILSDVMIPAQALKGSTDPRALGVCVRDIMLLSTPAKVGD